jgi:hypothetical protein
MNSKYWTSSHKSTSIQKSPSTIAKKNSNINLDEVETSTATSIDDDLTIKMNTIHNGKRNDHLKEKLTKSSSSIMKRPDSLELSFDYGSTTDLSKTTAISNSKSSGINSNNNNNNNIGSSVGIQAITANNSVDVNQSKSLSVTGNKSHHDGKKSTTSYDLWVNESVVAMKEKSENSVTIAREKKLDLPGRVSFRYVKKFFQARNNYILLECGIVNVKAYEGFVAEVILSLS